MTTWSLRTALDLEAVNVHLLALREAGLLGIAEEHGVATAYFPAHVEGLPVPGEWAEVPDRDWLAVWREGLDVVTVGTLAIAPPWLDGEGAIVIDPGQAFGTGHHETTTGCLAALQELALAGRSVLDVGTGSGVLAIAAARLGAERVVAIDVDPLAVAAARDNAARNGVAIDVREGSLAAAPERFDVVVANLDTATVAALADDLRDRTGGTLICSGVSVERQAEAIAALTAAGLTPAVRAGQEWVVLVAEAPVEVVLDGIAHGGEAVGRLPDGKACFVAYAIPGERVRVVVTEQRRRWARGRLVDVVEASPDRVEPPCPYFGPDRCGGCQLQHIAPTAQAALKRRVVAEQLARIGKITDPNVSETVAVLPFSYRNRARFGVDAEGRLGFRRAGRGAHHDLIPIDRCLLLEPEAQALRDEAGDDWRGVAEVVVRSAADGNAVVVTPGPGGMPPLPAGDAPVVLVSGRGRAVALRGDPTLCERVDGVGEFRVSPTSFFQASREGAAVLARLVREAVAVRPGETALDLHAGVGLFAAVLAAEGATVTAIEANPGAADDARVNLPDSVEVLTDDVDAVVARLAAEGSYRDIVVLDPPRRGAGPALCRDVAALDPRVVVYVSCDPAALARDAAVLAQQGYTLARAVPVDQFAQTAQIETVATFLPG